MLAKGENVSGNILHKLKVLHDTTLSHKIYSPRIVLTEVAISIELSSLY